MRLILQHIKPAGLNEDEQKPVVVALRAKLAVAGKMISIVEIVKKNIQETDGQWWQYSTTAVLGQNATTENSITSALPAHSSGTSPSSCRRGGPGKSKRDLVDGPTFEQDDVFETMLSSDSTYEREASLDTTDRAHMIVYLASVPIPELQELYG